jgi:16S rRNA (guanine966-N2)-methyltransferase
VRVIGGEAKGTRLVGPRGGIRPVSDRAREGVFASLGGLVAGARCLDLYAGTGALGVEALSRGAARCVFVDSSVSAVRTIRENLSRAGFADRGLVLRAEVRRFLARPSDPFDLVFADPPYAIRKGTLGVVLNALARRLDRSATFVLTRPSRDSTDVIPLHFRVVRRLIYGDTLVLFCREEQ